MQMQKITLPRLYVGLSLATCGALALIGIAAAFGVPEAHTLLAFVFDPHVAGGGLLANGVAALDPEKIEKALKDIGDKVKEEGERLIKETEKNGQATAKMKELVDDLLTKQGGFRAELDDVLKKLAKNEKEAKEETEDLLGRMRKGWAEFSKPFVDSPVFGKHAKFDVTRDQLEGAFAKYMAQKALTNTGVTGAALNYPGVQILPQPLRPLQRRLTVRDLIASGRTSKAILWYPRESGYTNNAAPVSEGSLKPKSEITFETITEPVRTIAHMLDISLQMLDDVEFIESYVGTRLMDGLKLVEENQLLMGSGTGQNLSGIYTEATAYSAPTGAAVNGVPIVGQQNASETDIDKLRIAVLQVELAFAFASGFVLHPTDWANIELLKDSTGQYLFVNPQNSTQPRLWGRPVVATPAMTQGRFLTGDFAAHVQVFDRQDANIQISFENKDNFERNMATLRCEERLALAIYRPEALVKGSLESAS